MSKYVFDSDSQRFDIEDALTITKGLWADGNPNSEDRLGLFVTASNSGLKVRVAKSNSYICGVTVSHDALLGSDVGNPLYCVVQSLGVCVVQSDGTVVAGDKCMPNSSGQATKSDNELGFRVIDVIDSGHVQIIMSPNNDMIKRIIDDVNKLTENKIFANNESFFYNNQISQMVFIPSFKISELIDGGSNNLHPAFIINNSSIDGIWISKYQNGVRNKISVSKLGAIPASYISWELAFAYSISRGRGWHLMSRAEWGAIVLWCIKNGFIPYGNIEQGKDPRESVRSGKISDNMYIYTGTGSNKYSHNCQPDGIYDLVGNVAEYVSGVRLFKGEIQFLPNNDAADSDNSQEYTSNKWKALDANTGEFIPPDGSGTTSNSVKVNCVNGKPQYSTAITTTSDCSCAYEELTCDKTIGTNAKTYLMCLCLLPLTNKTYSGSLGIVNFNNNSNEYIFACGGSCKDGSSAGICSIKSVLARRNTSGNGFRSAYASLPLPIIIG